MKKEYKDILNLIKVSLGEKISKDKFKNIDFDKIYKISKNHCIETLIFEAIEKLKLELEPNLYQEWKETSDEVIINDIKQYEESKLIKRILTDNKIEYLFMKGQVLKELYPKTYMRSMGDIDILIKEKNRKNMKNILINLGYDVEKYNKDNEDIYVKDPIYVIEVHTELFEKYTIYHHYFKNLFENRLLKNNYENNFNIEDMYIYIIIHLAKHYHEAGAGIRNIIDIYIYRKKYLNQMDKDYIDKLLKKFEVDEFEQRITKLIDVYFYNKKEDKESTEMINYIFEAGIYGNEDIVIENGLKQYNSKLNLYIHKFFPSINYMKKIYPIINNTILLLPVMYIYRWIEIIIKRPKNIINTTKLIFTKRK